MNTNRTIVVSLKNSVLRRPTLPGGPSPHSWSARLLLGVLLTVFVAAWALQRAEAATYYFDNNSNTPGFGTAGGTWAAPTAGPMPGWTTDGTGATVPGSVTTTTSDPINFGNGATGLGAGTITLSGALSSSNVTFASGSGSIVISGGTSLTLPATATITVNNSSNTIATPLAGAGTSLTKAGTGALILSGANTVNGNIVVNSGELRLNGASFNLGAKTLTLAPAASANQTAVFNVINANFTNANNMAIAYGTNAIGIIKLSSGSLVNTTNSLNLGSGANVRTNFGAFLMSGGTAIIGLEFNLARDGSNAAALVSLSGGTLICSNYGTVGREGFGVIDISGGTFFRPATALNRFYMGRTAGQFAQLTIRGTGTMNYDDNAGLYFANSTTPVLSGMVNLLTGGTLVSRVGITWNANAVSVGHFNFNGGTLKASGSSATYWNGLWTACYIYGGGATIDSQGNNITIAQPFLVPTGSGVASITGGAGSGYLAPPVVSITGDGMGATAIAQIDTSGTVTNILVTNPGVDYTTVPTVTLIGGGGTGSGWTAAIGANATTGGLTKLGSGTLTLSSASAHTYQGPTKVGGGTLAMSALNHPSASTLTLSNSTFLNLDVAGGAVSLATPSLVLDNNTALTLSYGALTGNPFIPAISDSTGSGTTLDARGTNIVINITGSGFAAGQFQLIKYSGTIGGNGFAAFKLGTLPPGVVAQLVNNTLASSVDLNILPVNTLTWNGNVSANWDINATANWKDAVLAAATYKEYGTTNLYGDMVTFDDSLANPSRTNVNLTTTLHPITVNFAAFNTPYAISGPGKLSGLSYLTVGGGAQVKISTANDHTGGSLLSGGTVLVGNDAALGLGTVTLAGSVLSSDSSSPRSLANPVNFTANTTFGGDPASGRLTFSGPVNLGAATPELTLNNEVVIAGSTSGSGFSKLGGPTLTFDNSSNQLTGTATINAGKVVLNKGSFTAALNLASTLGSVAVLEIVNGNVTNTAANNIGTGINAFGVIKQSGGSFVSSGATSFGNAPDNGGAYLISGGYAYFGGDTRFDNVGAVGLLSQTGGNVVSANWFTIARDGGVGVLDISGGTFLRPVSAANRFYLGSRASGGFAQLTIRGTGTLDVEDSGGLSFGNNNATTSYGMVNILTGGTLVSRVGFYWGNTTNNSIGCVNFSGGTLRASGDAANYWSGWTAAYIYSGGATIDSQSFNIGIGQALLAPSGSGVTAITGSGSGYVAPPVVQIIGDGAGATAVAEIDGSGNITNFRVTNPGIGYSTAPTVNLVGGGGSGGCSATIGSNATTGGLTKLGTGTLTLSGANTYAGSTFISAGTLVLGKAHAGPGTVTVSDGATLGCWSDTPGVSVSLPSATLGVSSGAGLLAQFSGVAGNPTTPAGYITNLTLNGSTPVSVTCTGIRVGTFPLVRYTTLAGTGAVITGALPQGVVGTVTNNPVTKTIELTVTSVAPLLWTGAASGTWDIGGAANWALGGTAKAYLDGDNVRLDDTAVNPVIVITQAVSPGSIVFSNSALTYSVGTSGSGALSGGADLTKDGTNTLILSGVNSYTGTTVINAGTAQIGVGGTAGTISGEIAIGPNGTFLHNRSDNVGNFFNNISGSGALRKIGAELGLTGTNSFSGTIYVDAGKVGLSGSRCVDGVPSVNMTSGTLSVGTGFVGGTCTIGNLTGTGNIDPVYGSTVGTRTLQVNQTSDGTFSGNLRDGSGSRVFAFTKTGPAKLTLSVTGTHTGPTVVSNGTLIVNGTISNSTVAVEAGATLGGTAFFGATVTVASGGTLSPGASIGTMTFATNLDLAGVTIMEVTKDGGLTNDVLDVAGPLGYGGILQVVLAGSTPLAVSDTFKVFTFATAPTGSFSEVNMPSGYTWDTTQLAVDGTVRVIGIAAPPTLNFSRIGDNLQFSWNGTYKLMAQTNSLGVGISTNWFVYPGGGTSGVLVPIDAANGTVFFRLSVP